LASVSVNEPPKSPSSDPLTAPNPGTPSITTKNSATPVLARIASVRDSRRRTACLVRPDRIW